MKQVLWFVAGVGVGFLVAHEFSKTEPGERFFGEVNRRAREFSDAVSEGFRERTNEIRSALDDLQEELS